MQSENCVVQRDKYAEILCLHVCNISLNVANITHNSRSIIKALHMPTAFPIRSLHTLDNYTSIYLWRRLVGFEKQMASHVSLFSQHGFSWHLLLHSSKLMLLSVKWRRHAALGECSLHMSAELNAAPFTMQPAWMKTTPPVPCSEMNNLFTTPLPYLRKHIHTVVEAIYISPSLCHPV